MADSKTPTTVDRVSDRELIVTRTFDAPAQVVFAAWTKPELFRQWWAPKSMGATLSACEIDARTGSGYSITFGDDPAQAMTFFGKYLDVAPAARLVWTNDETGEAQVTTVTFEDRGGQTRLTLSERYPSPEPLDEAIQGMCAMAPEQFNQLDELLATLGEGVG